MCYIIENKKTSLEIIYSMKGKFICLSIFCIIFLFELFPFADNIFAQYYSEPDWVNNPPDGYLNNYFVGIGIDRDYQNALQYALANATQKFQKKYEVESLTIIDKTPIADRSRVLVKVHGEHKTLFLKIVDVFVKFGIEGYKVYLLVSSPKESYEIRELPSNSGALLRSTIFPGWGQFYKKHTERGLLFLLIEGLGIGTSIMLYHRTVYQNAPQLRTKFNLVLGITIGVHILNIIDSITIEPNIKYK